MTSFIVKVRALQRGLLCRNRPTYFEVMARTSSQIVLSAEGRRELERLARARRLAARHCCILALCLDFSFAALGLHD